MARTKIHTDRLTGNDYTAFHIWSERQGAAPTTRDHLLKVKRKLDAFVEIYRHDGLDAALRPRHDGISPVLGEGFSKVLSDYDVYAHGVLYTISNEILRGEQLATMNALVDGIGRYSYIGICGGGNQNIFLLDRLSRKPESVILIDSNPLQLLNFMYLSRQVNRSGSFGQLLGRLARHNSGFGLGIIQAFDLTPGLNPVLEHNDVTRFINRIRESGRYLIYLSNVFPTHSSSPSALEAMLKNPHIDDGSLAVVIGYDSRIDGSPLSMTYLLAKRGGRFEIEDSSLDFWVSNMHGSQSMTIEEYGIMELLRPVPSLG